VVARRIFEQLPNRDSARNVWRKSRAAYEQLQKDLDDTCSWGFKFF
jgi:hypothetical protein